MKISYDKKSTDYLPVLDHIMGGKLVRIYDVMIFFYVLSTSIVMLAGSWAVGQYFNLSYWWGVIIIVVDIIVLFSRNINGLLSINEYLIPMLISGLLYILLKFTFDQELLLFSHLHEQSNWIAAFPFTALHVLPLIAVFGAIGSQIESEHEIWLSFFIYHQSVTMIIPPT